MKNDFSLRAFRIIATGSTVPKLLGVKGDIYNLAYKRYVQINESSLLILYVKNMVIKSIIVFMFTFDEHLFVQHFLVKML